MNRLMAVDKRMFFFILVILIWTRDIIIDYCRAVLLRIPLLGSYPDLIILIIFIIFILLSFSSYRINIKDIFFLLGFVSIYFIDWNIYQENRLYLSTYIYDFLIKILPIYVIGVSLQMNPDRDRYIHVLYVLSMTTIVANILYHFTLGGSMDAVTSQYNGDMDGAYKLLPHCCVVGCFAVKHPNRYNVPLAIIGGFFLLMLGTRGAALIYMAMVGVLLILGQDSKWIIARIILIFGSVGGFVASPLFIKSILALSDLATKFGLSVRVFDKFLSGKALTSTGRDSIRETLVEAIWKKPITGYGLCGDRVFTGIYAHNIAIELWVDFGIFAGTLILVIIAVVIFRGYMSADSEESKSLIMALSFSSFLMLFLSGSFLDNKFFMLLIGLSIGSVRVSKLNREISDDVTTEETDEDS